MKEKKFFSKKSNLFSDSHGKPNLQSGFFAYLGFIDKIILAGLLLFIIGLLSTWQPSEMGKNTWVQRHKMKFQKQTERPSFVEEKTDTKAEPAKSEPIKKDEEQNRTVDSKSQEVKPTPPPSKPEPPKKETDKLTIKKQDTPPLKPKTEETTKPQPQTKPKETKIDDIRPSSVASEVKRNEPQTTTRPANKTNVKFTLLGIYGYVEIDEVPVTETEDLGKTFDSMSNVYTEENSWVIIETGDLGSFAVFPNSELDIKGTELTLLEGKVLNRSTFFNEHHVDVLTLKPIGNRDEFVYFTELGKARIFTLGSRLNIVGFDKTKSMGQGLGASVFILNRQINLYNAKPAVKNLQISKSNLISWSPESTAIHYFVLVDFNEGGQKKSSLFAIKETEIQLPENSNIKSVRVYYENDFASWSVPAVR